MPSSVVRLAVVAALGVAPALAVGACDATAGAPSATPTANPNGGIVRVAAAYSLAFALSGAKAEYEAANPGSHLTLTFGATPALAQEVQVGGFDAFVSEDLASAQEVVADRHGAGPAQVFAFDRVVLIVPSANPSGIRAPADLAKAGVRIAAPADGSPLAALTTEVVGQIAAVPGTPAGFAAAVAANTKRLGDDPRDVVKAVEGGAADAAFVYASDMVASTTVSRIALPDAVAAGAVGRFAVVVIAAAGDPVAAAGFARWLTTDAGQKALAPYGFLPPDTP